MVKSEAILYCARHRGAFDRNTLEVVPQIRFEENASHGIYPSCKERLPSQDQP